MNSTPIYSLRVPDVFRSLETSPTGLSAEEVKARRSLYGDNLLSEPPKVSPWMNFITHSIHPMAVLLWFAGGLSFLVREPVLGVIIWLLVVANAVFSYWREYRAEQAIEALRRLLPNYARLIRASEEGLVSASEVVPGDVVVLAEGDNIPADARLVESYGLRTNNSTLTGEAVPARKIADASIQDGLSEVERPNLVFAGTSVVSGTGKAVVFATGMSTQFGRIARLTQAVREGPSPLQKELVRITRVFSIIAVAIGVIVFTVGTVDVGLPTFDAFILALGIIVAVIPEGLPATITLSLAMAVQRLAQRGVLVKKLSILETLGTVSIICTDKSGTLTQNQMTVRDAWVARERLSISGAGYEPKGKYFPDPAGSPYEMDWKALLEAAALCNNSRINPPTPEKPQWTGLGDQTEVALRVAELKGGIDEHALGLMYPRVHELPFDARRKRMSTIHRSSLSQEIAFVKGAPREVLSLCTHILIHGEEQPLDNALRSEIISVNDGYARRALRVLAFARRTFPAHTGGYTVERVERDLTFLGLMAMMDPPRPEVAEAVKVCRQAGIRMVMITGDYGLTAESLARRVGMLSTSNPVILTGADIDNMNDVELQVVLEKEVIFARMAPEHKLRLVSAYQARGEVVVVTGDGVNDAPALRKADVGVSMGLIGTDVAKEAADMIITNDNFAAIVSAIEEGRAIYDNLRKFITYIFSSNVPEVLPFLLTSLLNIPLALTVRQVLLIDLGTDLLPALALGTERPEPNVMNRPPRRRSKPLIDRGLLTRAFLWLGLIEAALCYGGFFIVFQVLKSPHISELSILKWLAFRNIVPSLADLPLERSYTLAVTVFLVGVVTAQIGNAFACRSEKEKGHHLGWFSNPMLWLGIGVEVALMLLLVYIHPLAGIFQLEPLPLIYWVGLISYGLVLYALDRIRKEIVWAIEKARNGRQGGSRL